MDRATIAEAAHDGVVPANLTLAEAELSLAGKMGRELTLRRALGLGRRRLGPRAHRLSRRRSACSP